MQINVSIILSEVMILESLNVKTAGNTCGKQYFIINSVHIS